MFCMGVGAVLYNTVKTGPDQPFKSIGKSSRRAAWSKFFLALHGAGGQPHVKGVLSCAQ